MSEQLQPPKPAVMNGIGTPDEGYYCHDVNCMNCGARVHYHVRKGVIQSKTFAECERCGVSINLSSGSILPWP